MTTKIAIKPQSEYTADELRALDEWAAGFVDTWTAPSGRVFKMEGSFYKEVGNDNDPLKPWKPSLTVAPLWQLSAVLEKLHSSTQPKGISVDQVLGELTIRYLERRYTGDLALLIFQNPATVLAAILEVTTNE